MKRLPLLVVAVSLSAASLLAQSDTPVNSADAYQFLLGKLSEKGGDVEDAIRMLDRLIQKSPDDTVLLYERAQMYAEISRGDKAEADLRKIVRLNPNFYDAQRLLGRLLLDRSGGDLKKVEQALEHLDAAYRLNPDDLSSGVAASQILVSLGRLEEAEKIVSSLLDRAPDQRILNFTYAQILTKLGRGDESRPYLERVLQNDPTYGPAVFQLVDLYEQAKEWSKAAETLQPLISRDPLNLDLQRQQGLLYLRAGDAAKARARLEELTRADPADERSAFYLAEALSDLGAHREADAIYERLLKKNPNDPDVLVGYGLSLLAQEKYDAAERSFRALLATENLSANAAVLARTQLALIDLQRGDLDAALGEARPVMTLENRPNLQAINIALEVLRRQKKYADAIALIQPLRERYPQEPYMDVRYMEFLLRTGEDQKANELANRQLKMDGDRPLAIADAYAAAEKFGEGVEYLEKLRKMRPEDRDVLFQIGSFYERAGKEKQAENAFLQLLAKSPDDAPALNYLGYMWADRGVNLEKSAEMLERAISIEPQNGAYLDSLGWAYFRLGKLDLAERYLDEAAQILPKDPTVQEHLGDLFARKGEYSKARERYRTALDLQPQPEEESQLKIKLAEAEKLSSAPKAH